MDDIVGFSILLHLGLILILYFGIPFGSWSMVWFDKVGRLVWYNLTRLGLSWLQPYPGVLMRTITLSSCMFKIQPI